MKLAALIVCHNSGQNVCALVEDLRAQTTPPAVILIVDNASTEGTQHLLKQLEQAHASVHVFYQTQNTGGAGGYHRGFVEFNQCKEGCDALVTFDDDARAKDPALLETLLKQHEKQPDAVVGALVVDLDDETKTAFSYKLGDKRSRDVATLRRYQGLLQDVKLFSGVLFPRSVTQSFPGPKPELFIRGDEQELKQRLEKAGITLVTTPAARCFHPSSQGEVIHCKNIRVFTESSPGKYYFIVRNWAYLMREHPRHSRFVRSRILLKTLAANAYFILFKSPREKTHGLRWFYRAFSDGVNRRFDTVAKAQAAEFLDKARSISSKQYSE
ncbi:MAG: glycosyltransferase [Pseudomonadota bacterium]|nr:glycosyltransferase [Pseudomonadota bacterium]